jgi:hypothetical protein
MEAKSMCHKVRLEKDEEDFWFYIDDDDNGRARSVLYIDSGGRFNYITCRI